MSRFLFAFVCALALLTASSVVRADDATSAAVAAPAADAPGCPNADGGKCCATCQDRAARAAAGEAPPAAPVGECPCQRAKRLREEAAAKAAAEQGAD